MNTDKVYTIHYKLSSVSKSFWDLDDCPHLLPSAVPETIHTPSIEGIGISERWGFCETKTFKEIYERSVRKSPICQGYMDIFWNYAISFCLWTKHP